MRLPSIKHDQAVPKINYKEEVAGSNPASPTTFKSYLPLIISD